jgi:hypothetical protein
LRNVFYFFLSVQMMRNQAKRLKFTKSFPDDILTGTLQFAINSVKTWCVFTTVNRQFNRCAHKHWVLSHLNLDLPGVYKLGWLRVAGVCPKNLSLTFDGVDQTSLLHYDALRSLSLDQATDAYLQEVAKLISLRSLCITNAKITDQGLLELAALPLLTDLKVTNSTRVTDSGLGTLAMLTPLSALKLHDCPLLSGQGLRSLTSLPIKCLELVNCTFIGNEDLQTISNMRALSSVTLGPCVYVDARGLGQIARLPLSDLDLRGCLLTNDWLLPVSSIKTLKHLRLHTGPGSRVTTFGLKALQPLVQLESLEWRFEMGDQALQALRPLVALRSINLGSDLSDLGLGHLSNMTGLTTVILYGMPAVTDRGLSSLHLLSSLEELILEDLQHITGEGLLGLGDLASFHKLSISGCKNVTDSGLSGLSSMPYLQSLGVVGARLKNPNFVHFPVLSRLNLSDCRYLLNTSLAQLQTAAPKLTSLDASYCVRLSDEGLESLVPHLIEIKLSGTRVTDRCFAQLCSPLRKLDVSECSDLEGNFLHQRFLPNIEDLCLSNCDGLYKLGSLPTLVGTLKKLDVSFCDYITNDLMDKLEFIPRLSEGGCIGWSDDETSQKVEPVQADSPNAATNLLIEALSDSPRPNTHDFFTVMQNDSTISLLQGERQVLAIAWADIDWKHIAWHFGNRQPRWAFFLMDNSWIQVHARTVPYAF